MVRSVLDLALHSFEELHLASQTRDLLLETVCLGFADVAFLVKKFRLTRADLAESFERLPSRFKADPVVQDNFRYVVEDCL